jgi:hypothetical protein
MSTWVVAEAEKTKDVPWPLGMAVLGFEWSAGGYFVLINRPRS